MNTELVAGLAGGLIAIAGAFGVQVLVTRAGRIDRARALAAAVLADVQNVNATRIAREQDPVGISLFDLVRAFDTATRSGQELALIVKPSTAEAIRETLLAVRDLMFLNEGEEQEKREKYFSRYRDLQDRLADELGRSR